MPAEKSLVLIALAERLDSPVLVGQATLASEKITWFARGSFRVGSRPHAYRMIQRRARAIGITPCLDNGGTLENAQLMAALESPCTTKLYDRTGDTIILDEVDADRDLKEPRSTRPWRHPAQRIGRDCFVRFGCTPSEPHWVVWRKPAEAVPSGKTRCTFLLYSGTGVGVAKAQIQRIMGSGATVSKTLMPGPPGL